MVLWLLVLGHAKSTGRRTAFVTGDNGFWEIEQPRGQILLDIASNEVDVRLYKDLAEFTKDNALISEVITAAWVDAHLTTAQIEEVVVDPLREALKSSRRLSGTPERVTPTELHFTSGAVYKIDSDTDFAELNYRGIFVVESVSFSYQPLTSGNPPLNQGPIFGGLTVFGTAGFNPMIPQPGFFGSAPMKGEVRRNKYDVTAEIRLSCRIEANSTVLDVDEIKPEKIVPH